MDYKTMVLNSMGLAFKKTPISVNGRAIYCLTDNGGRIISKSEIDSILFELRDFYNIPDIDVIIEKENSKLEKNKRAGAEKTAEKERV
jgi:hypothetical protein